MESNALREGLNRYLSEKQLDLLRSASVGIAGAGGLGSNVAMLLARSGLEHFTLIDYDIVEASNLNRQHFWPQHLGKKKVEALKEILLALNPHISLQIHHLYLDEYNLPPLLGTCDIWVEALDEAKSKALFVEKALLAEKSVVSASGICGIGGKALCKRHCGQLLITGDFETDFRKAPPMAPRVVQAAAIMADAVLESVLGPEKENYKR